MPEDADLGLRERKKRERSDAIVDAAQRLVLEHGLDAVTVEAIAEAVDVSPRTFFNYFDSKDDAVLGQQSFGIDPAALEAFVDGGPTGQFMVDLEAFVVAVLSAVAGSPSRAARAFELMEAEPRLVARHVAWLERHRSQIAALFTARGERRPLPADADFCAIAVLALLRTASERWERAGQQGDVTDHVHGAVGQLAAFARS